jgi:hypothetical protein
LHSSAVPARGRSHNDLRNGFHRGVASRLLPKSEKSQPWVFLMPGCRRRKFTPDPHGQTDRTGPGKRACSVCVVKKLEDYSEFLICKIFERISLPVCKQINAALLGMTHTCESTHPVTLHADYCHKKKPPPPLQRLTNMVNRRWGEKLSQILPATGLRSVDRNNKATLPLTRPGRTNKSYAKDLSPRIVKLPYVS